MYVKFRLRRPVSADHVDALALNYRRSGSDTHEPGVDMVLV